MTIARIFRKPPTAAQFVSSWTREFEAQLKKAAGPDGLITLARLEAARTRLHSPEDWGYVVLDNAKNLLEKTGRTSMKVSEAVKAARGYVKAQASRVVGDGALSLSDARKMAKDLHADYFVMRGLMPDGYNPLPQAKKLSAVERFLDKTMDPLKGPDDEITREVPEREIPAAARAELRRLLDDSPGEVTHYVVHNRDHSRVVGYAAWACYSDMGAMRSDSDYQCGHIVVVSPQGDRLLDKLEDQ